MDLELEGAKISCLKRKIDLIMLDIVCQDEKHIFLHSLCSLRIFANDRLIVSSWDMTKKGKRAKKHFNWEYPLSSKFDDELEEHIGQICSVSIKSATFLNKNLFIDLENGVRLEFLIDTVASEEKYKISIMT